VVGDVSHRGFPHAELLLIGPVATSRSRST
jgi:hypothetical protein